MTVTRPLKLLIVEVPERNAYEVLEFVRRYDDMIEVIVRRFEIPRGHEEGKRE